MYYHRFVICPASSRCYKNYWVDFHHFLVHSFWVANLGPRQGRPEAGAAMLVDPMLILAGDYLAEDLGLGKLWDPAAF